MLDIKSCSNYDTTEKKIAWEFENVFKKCMQHSICFERCNTLILILIINNERLCNIKIGPLICTKSVSKLDGHISPVHHYYCNPQLLNLAFKPFKINCTSSKTMRGRIQGGGVNTMKEDQDQFFMDQNKDSQKT